MTSTVCVPVRRFGTAVVVARYVSARPEPAVLMPTKLLEGSAVLCLYVTKVTATPERPEKPRPPPPWPPCPLTEPGRAWPGTATVMLRLAARRSGTFVVEATRVDVPPFVLVSTDTKLWDATPSCGYVTNATDTPARPVKPRPAPMVPRLVAVCWAGSSRANVVPSAPVPPPVVRANVAGIPLLGKGSV